MPERIKITIRGSHSDVLTIQDAMRQVLDIFETLEQAPGLTWKLLRATTNTPFFVEGEAIGPDPTIDVSVVARAQKQTFARNWRNLSSGLATDPEFHLGAAKRVLARTLNGVSATEIDFDDGDKVTFTPALARQAIEALEKTSSLFDRKAAREEIGSVEGTLQYVGTYYETPAIRIIEARTQDYLWCRLSEQLQTVFQDKATYNDVWRHRRVMVRGRIKYNTESRLVSVDAADIRQIDPRPVSLREIKDENFTGGLSIVEYLDRFRDGTLD